MTDTISFGPGPVARQVVAEGDGDTLIINQGPDTVFFGGNNAIRATDASGIVPIGANSYFGVNGKSDMFGCVAAGKTASLQIISGGLNFFLPVTSLTIPYGATGQRIVINDPAFPGSIVGYNPAGLIEFIISPNGYLIYDATGGALNHLFIALQNQAGADTFGNPFAKGIQVGPQTGPQVLIAGGNPAFVSFPANDSGFDSSKPSIFTSVGSGVSRYASLALQGPTTSVAAHDDSIELNLNSPNADGTSSANFQLYYIDIAGTTHAYYIQDYTGIIIQACSTLKATDPVTGTSIANPATTEQWHNVAAPSGWGGSSRYKKLADSNFCYVEFSLTNPGASGNLTVLTLPPQYWPASNSTHPVCTIASGTANLNMRGQVNATGTIQVFSMPATTTAVFGHFMYALD